MNLAFLAGMLWGMHDIKKQQDENIDYANLSVKDMLDATAKAKKIQFPEKYILDHKKEKFLEELKTKCEDSTIILIFEKLVDEALLDKHQLNYLIKYMK